MGKTISHGKAKVISAILAAAVLWFIMFSPWTAPHLDFWTAMSCSAVVLAALASLSCPEIWKGHEFRAADIVLGIALAAALWGIFWAGDKISSGIFGFARPQVDMIYGIKGGTSPWILSALLLLLIGPAEEIFWRGYIQRTLSGGLGADAGAALTLALYSLVHIPSWNFMLVMAALTAGAVWGLVYRFWPEKFGAVLVSHALWDAAVFVWFPI